MFTISITSLGEFLREAEHVEPTLCDCIACSSFGIDLLNLPAPVYFKIHDSGNFYVTGSLAQAIEHHPSQPIEEKD